MACAAHAPGLAAQMAEFAVHAPAYDKQLHVLYLANDVLLKGCAPNFLSPPMFWPNCVTTKGISVRARQLT
jgi:hypothetical protein